MGVPLHELEQRIVQLSDALAAHDEAGTEPSPELVEAYRELVTGERDKVNAIYHVLREFGRNAMDCREEASAQRERAKMWERRWDRLADYVLMVMQATGQSKFEGPLATLSMVKGKSSLEVEPDKVPDDYAVVEPVRKLKTDEIRAALKQGVIVPGARMVAGEPSLRVTVAKRSSEEEEHGLSVPLETAPSAPGNGGM